MAEHEGSTIVDVSADALFDYLSDVHNLPKYFPRMTSAQPAEGEAVQVTARMPDGQAVEAEAWFRVNAEHHRIEWGSKGSNDYHGWLQVRGQGGPSSVEVHISTERVTDGEVDRGIEETLAAVKRLVEEGV
jgi:uncharacterized membrane protein